MSDQISIAARRVGYGLSRRQGAATSPRPLLDGLDTADDMSRIWPVPGMTEVLPILQEAQAGRRERRMTGAPSETYETAVRLSRQVARDAARATIARALDAPCGFRERLV